MNREELSKLSYEELQKLYLEVNAEAPDEWFPIMYVTDECPYCGGETHPLENFHTIYMKEICFNLDCIHPTKEVDSYYKDEALLVSGIIRGLEYKEGKR